MRWKTGAQIVQYEMWGRGVGTARPVTVIRDVPSHIALYSHPRTPMVTRGIEGFRSLSLSKRVELHISMLDASVGEFREEITPENHVLTLIPHNSWHSVMLFWSSDWEFRTWYVNLQSPYRRVRQGVQHHDYVLDLVVRPDMSWSWKDTDEFEDLIAQGFFRAGQIASIRAEADRMIQTIEGFGPPFCDGWEDWRPDVSWPVPQLPDDWFELGAKEPGTS